MRRRARQAYHGGQGQDECVQLFVEALRAAVFAGRSLDSPQSEALERPHPNYSRSCAHCWPSTMLGVEVLFLRHERPGNVQQLACSCAARYFWWLTCRPQPLIERLDDRVVADRAERCQVECPPKMAIASLPNLSTSPHTTAGQPHVGHWRCGQARFVGDTQGIRCRGGAKKGATEAGGAEQPGGLLVKQCRQGYWSHFTVQVLNVQRSPVSCRLV